MASKVSRGGAQPNQSLIDGIGVLQALALSPEPVGVRELARRLSFEPTRVNRLLKTLAYLNIARQTEDRKYTAGPGMTVLAAQSMFASRFMQVALPELAKLRRFGHTVAMGVLWRDNVSYLYHAKPNTPDTDALGRIGLYPASQGGIGLALLAEQDDETVAEIYRGRNIPNFPDGINSLATKLEDIRSQGFTRVLVKDDPEQHTVAIRVGTPAIGAIGISGWIPESATGLIVSSLRDAAADIEAAAKESGHDPDISKLAEVGVGDTV